MKLVLDTNVIFSAFAAHGLANSIFELCLQQHTIIVSEQILRELEKNLQKKLKMPKIKIEAILSFLKEFCQICEPTKLNKAVCRDRNDDNIIGLAVASAAKYIISGDKDLLVLKKHGSIAILTPREFWERLKSKASKDRF